MTVKAVDVATGKKRHGAGRHGVVPLPPHLQKQGDPPVVEALADRLGRIAADDRVGRDVAGDTASVGFRPFRRNLTEAASQRASYPGRRRWQANEHREAIASPHRRLSGKSGPAP